MFLSYSDYKWTLLHPRTEVRILILIIAKISNEIQLAILKTAAVMEKKGIEKLVKERRKKDPRGGDNAIPQDQQ